MGTLSCSLCRDGNPHLSLGGQRSWLASFWGRTGSLSPALSGEIVTPHLALTGRDGLGVVAAVEPVNAAPELAPDQGLVLPAALGVGESHPLAQVLRLVGWRQLPAVS